MSKAKADRASSVRRMLRRARVPLDVFPELERTGGTLTYAHDRRVEECAGAPDAAELIAQLAWWCDVTERNAHVTGVHARDQSARNVASPTQLYRFLAPVGAGTSAHCFRAEYDGGHALLKVARNPARAPALDREVRVLAHLNRDGGPDVEHFAQYLPTHLETFDAVVGNGERHVTAFAYPEGFITLADVLAEFPNGIPPAAAVWMWRRMLEAAHWAHQRGVTHSTIISTHVLIQPDGADGKKNGHGAKLIGWSSACILGVADGVPDDLHRMQPGYESYYPPEGGSDERTPAFDLYMIAQCVIRLLCGIAGDASQAPAGVADRLWDLLRACVIPNPHRRYGDAWRLYQDLEEVIEDAFGSRRYELFQVPE